MALTYTEQQAKMAAAITRDTARQDWIDYRELLAELSRLEHLQLVAPGLSTQGYYRQLAAEKRLEVEEKLPIYSKAVAYLAIHHPNLLKALRADYGG